MSSVDSSNSANQNEEAKAFTSQKHIYLDLAEMEASRNAGLPQSTCVALPVDSSSKGSKNRHGGAKNMHSATPLGINSPNVKHSLELLKSAQNATAKKTIRLNTAQKSHSYRHHNAYDKRVGHDHKKSG